MAESSRPPTLSSEGGKQHGFVWILVLIAACYYGLYFRCGFNLSDEGSVALLSQRILQGERPFTDLMLGYNVLWFYPIVGLFWLFGVSLVAVKVYFFALATLSASLGYCLIRRLTGERLYAFAVGLILVALPGTSYRVYLPLLVVANTYCLLRMIWSRGWTWIALGGTVLGLTFLVRIDVGIFFAFLWLGTLVLRALGPLDTERHLPRCLPAILLVSGIAGAVHLPFYFVAKSQGFSQRFVQQYVQNFGILIDGLAQGIPKPTNPTKPARPAFFAKETITSAPAELPLTTVDGEPIQTLAPPPALEASRTTLARKPINQVWKARKWKSWCPAFITYAPIVSISALLAWSLSLGVRRRAEPEAYRRLLSILVLTGGSLTLFPQFFGFRPDASHLAEFMPGFVVAAAVGGFFIVQEFKRQTVLGRVAAIAVCVLLTAHTTIWVLYAFPQRAAGSIAMRSGRTEAFHAENGVNVLLTPKEHAGYSAIRDLVLKHSRPGEYVVCYPYSPGINVLANRPTYEWSLYVDNAAHPANFDSKTIAKMESKKPALVVIDDWAINQTDDSRFSVWAKKTQQYVEENYELQATILTYQIYARREAPSLKP